MAAMTGVMTSIAAFVSFKGEGLSFSNPQNAVFVVLPAAVAVAIAILSTLVRELEKTKMSKFSVNFAGLKAEFESKNKQPEETLNKKNQADA
jgi:hypothetical protein